MKNEDKFMPRGIFIPLILIGLNICLMIVDIHITPIPKLVVFTPMFIYLIWLVAAIIYSVYQINKISRKLNKLKIDNDR